MNGNELRKRKKRDAITRAAADLFGAHGIRRVSIAEIAAKADVNPVTVYNHFHDKDELVRALVEDLIDGEWAKYRGVLESDRPFLNRLEAIMTEKIAWARAHEGGLLGAALAESQAVRDLVASFFADKVTPLLMKFLREGQAEGIVRKKLSLEALNLYLEMFTGLARTHPQLFAGENKLGKTAKDVWDLFLHGLVGSKDV